MLNNFYDDPSFLTRSNLSKAFGNLVVELYISSDLTIPSRSARRILSFFSLLALASLEGSKADLLDACCDGQTRYPSHPPL